MVLVVLRGRRGHHSSTERAARDPYGFLMVYFTFSYFVSDFPDFRFWQLLFNVTIFDEHALKISLINCYYRVNLSIKRCDFDTEYGTATATNCNELNRIE